MVEKEFIFEKTVYLTDTNLFGNTYFARYFDWQGMAREAFFKQIVGDFNKFLQSRIKLVTIEAYIKYHHEVTLFDEVIIKVKPDNIQIATFNLIFTYLNKKTGQLVAEGRQKIGFVDSNNKAIPIPKKLKEGWERFQRK
ncbi:MAG: acyl-CoA thioesterase [Candidatus Omnitrophica bacterium]|nr:acyl-CoA thioesterase [Candidatus Omnitrophota bacterium]